MTDEIDGTDEKAQVVFNALKLNALGEVSDRIHCQVPVFLPGAAVLGLSVFDLVRNCIKLDTVQRSTVDYFITVLCVLVHCKDIFGRCQSCSKLKFLRRQYYSGGKEHGCTSEGLTRSGRFRKFRSHVTTPRPNCDVYDSRFNIQDLPFISTPTAGCNYRVLCSLSKPGFLLEQSLFFETSPRPSSPGIVNYSSDNFPRYLSWLGWTVTEISFAHNP